MRTAVPNLRISSKKAPNSRLIQLSNLLPKMRQLQTKSMKLLDSLSKPRMMMLNLSDVPTPCCRTRMMTLKLEWFTLKKLSKGKLKIWKVSPPRWTCSRWRTNIWKRDWWRPMIWCSKWANLLTFHETSSFKESYWNSMIEIKRWMRQWSNKGLNRKLMPPSQISKARANPFISSQMRLFRPRVGESNRMSELGTQNEKSPTKMCNPNLTWICFRIRKLWLLFKPKSRCAKRKEKIALRTAEILAIPKDLTQEEQAPFRKNAQRNTKRRLVDILKC